MKVPVRLADDPLLHAEQVSCGTRRHLAGTGDDLGKEALLLAACGRGARDEVEDLAVLQPIIGDLGYTVVRPEIDGQHFRADPLRLLEGDGPLAGRRDVIE